MTFVIQDWVGMLGLFPLWPIMAGIWFGLASVIKLAGGPSASELFAVVLGISSSVGALIGLHCGEFMYLPFADPACRWSALQLTTWAIR
jgi:hypothetical protein